MLKIDLRVGQAVRIGDDVRIVVMTSNKTRPNDPPTARLGFDAPRSISIMRHDFLRMKHKEPTP